MLPTPEEIVLKVQESVKYREIWPPVIRRLAAQESKKKRNLKKCVKAVKSTLHQVGGVYYHRKIDFKYWTEELRQAENINGMKITCQKMMEYHVSTQERMPYFEEMYNEVFSNIGPIQSIVDLGSGLNPLGLLWMPVDKKVRYDAYDIFIDQTDFLNFFLDKIERPGLAHLCDISNEPPQVEADVAFILKVLPILSHFQNCNALTFLQNIRVRWLIVSYPVASLGGHDKGMALNYSSRFEKMVTGESWTIQKKIYPSELVYIIDKHPQT